LDILHNNQKPLTGSNLLKKGPMMAGATALLKITLNDPLSHLKC